jgi:Phospholipase B
MIQRRCVVLFAALLMAAVALQSSEPQSSDPRLRGSYRRAPVNGWTLVHLEGSPAEIGFQHGHLLATEILEMKGLAELELKQDTQKSWTFFRDSARDMMWPNVEREYREELQGIADGVTARGVKLDLWDIVALNGLLEWGYYTKAYDKQRGGVAPKTAGAAEHCSAFVATGSYTRDGKVIIAHNNWSSYLDGARWTIAFDIQPARGHRVLMDGLPGLISSGDDFGLNSAGIMITETTITGFEGYDPSGIPEFVRARKAMQYASSIDDFARIMKERNNGGYANDWLVADRKTNEIASLELGLKNVTLDRKKEGYFVGANFPINPKLASEETNFDTKDLSVSANARRVRWEQLMAEHRGRIDVAAARQFLADHYDTFQKKTDPNERTLCGHVDLSPRGLEPWQPAFGTAGAVQNKVADATLAAELSFSAAAGHACGIEFRAASHLTSHPQFGWQKPFIRDLPSFPWTTLSAAK